MIYKYYSNLSEYSISNFTDGVLCFSHIDDFKDKNEFDIISDDEQLVGTGLDLSSYLKEYRAFLVRICSLCKRNNSKYMWKEYANDSNGFCLGYEVIDILKADAKIIYGNVEYKNTIPKLSESFTQYEIFVNQIFRKLLRFENENELRLAYIYPEESIKKVDFNANIDEDMFIKYLPISKNFETIKDPCYEVLPRVTLVSVTPKKVIIGKNCNDEYKRKLMNVANKKGIIIENQGDIID